MSLMTVVAGALLASSANLDTGLERIDVAYGELATGRAEQAIQRLSAWHNTSDPSVLVNLAAAYTRLGRLAEARKVLRAAIASPDRYDVELAGGRWIDSRNAARIALSRIERGYVMFGSVAWLHRQ